VDTSLFLKFTDCLQNERCIIFSLKCRKNVVIPTNIINDRHIFWNYGEYSKCPTPGFTQSIITECPIHTADADATQLSSWVASASAVWTEFATSSWRLPTDSVDNLETDQTDSIAVSLREFWSILITFSTMTSLCRHLSPTSIAPQHRKL